MIDLYYWTTPNGHKITIFLEEAQLESRPPTVRAYALAQTINTTPTVSEESRRVLFGQTAATGAR